MKKIVALLLVLVLCMGMTSAMADKLGSYMHTEVSKANAAGEKDGAYQADATMCAVVLDDNGVITEIIIGDDSFAETAGYGAKAKEEAFYSQFIGKSGTLAYGEGVDAISGATTDCQAVTSALTAAFAE